MNILALVAAIAALIIYIPTSVQVWQGKIQLNLASFLLWALLDAVAAASLFVNNGNWLLPAAYVVGCSLVIGAILRARTFSWKWFDTITATMVVFSILVWMKSGPAMATVVSTIGVVMASLPQTWDILRKPKEATIWIWAAYTVVNGVSTFAGKDWSISERLYSASCFVLTVIMFVLALRKLGRPIPQTATVS